MTADAPEPITITIPSAAWTALLAAVRLWPALTALELKVDKMSGDLSSQLDAATADITAKLTDISASVADMGTDIDELKVELASAIGGLNPGTTITQEQIDRIGAVSTSLDRLRTDAAEIAGRFPPPMPSDPAA